MILSRHQAPGAFPFVLILDHLKPGFNVGKILRVANALGAREVHFVGVGPFDPSPAKGTLRQTKSRSFEHIKDSFELLRADGYEIFSMEPGAEATLGQFELPEKSAFVLGHEEFGVSFTREEFPFVRPMAVRQFGRVQSLNVSIAAGLVAYEYVRARPVPEGAKVAAVRVIPATESQEGLPLD